jgi:hypothetical protein
MSFEIYSIGTIFKNVPNIYPCSDGTYSDRSSKRACSNHGGLQSDTPINICSETDVKLIPLSHIFHDLKNFQNRKEGFSARSVSNIVTAVKENTFKWENFDAITLWLSPDKKLILKRTTFGVFDNSKPLNLENLSQKTPTEQNYDREVSTLQTEILNLEKEIKDKQKDLSNRGATETQIIKLTEGLMVTLTRKRKQYYDVLQRRGNVIDASKNERSLFDSVGKLKYFDL